MLLAHDEGGEKLYVSVPPGGPIYVPDMVGPVTRVPDFETSVFQELQSLKEELSGDSLETFDDEILVDELKIIREDELVNKAFEEAFKGGELALDASQFTEEHLSPRRTYASVSGPDHAYSQNSESDMKAIVPSEFSNVLPLTACDKKKSNKNPSRKRKKRKCDGRKNNFFDESYIAKVEQLARIKQKQEEDRAAVRLHSFNGSSRIRECRAMTKKAHKIRSLKSSSVSTKARSSNPCDNVPVHFPEAVLSFEVYHNRRTWLKDVFCNDTRDSTSIDYSKPILDWLENSKTDALEKWEFVVAGELQQKQQALLGSETKQQLPRLKAVHMLTTRFCDIRFRLGAGYLYRHQGNCKHAIVIRNLRLIHPEDMQNRAAYPLATFQLKFRYRKCSVCKICKAQKIAVDDKWASSNPSYFCDVCYYMLHYVNGSLLYNDFSVHDYHPE